MTPSPITRQVNSLPCLYHTFRCSRSQEQSGTQVLHTLASLHRGRVPTQTREMGCSTTLCAWFDAVALVRTGMPAPRPQQCMGVDVDHVSGKVCFRKGACMTRDADIRTRIRGSREMSYIAEGSATRRCGNRTARPGPLLHRV